MAGQRLHLAIVYLEKVDRGLPADIRIFEELVERRILRADEELAVILRDGLNAFETESFKQDDLAGS